VKCDLQYISSPLTKNATLLALFALNLNGMKIARNLWDTNFISNRLTFKAHKQKAPACLPSGRFPPGLSANLNQAILTLLLFNFANIYIFNREAIFKASGIVPLQDSACIVKPFHLHRYLCGFVRCKSVDCSTICKSSLAT